MLKRVSKAVISIMLAVLLVFGAFAGCKREESGLLDQYKNRPNEVKVVFFNGGYGEKWITNIAKYYMDNIDTQTYVNLIPSELDGQLGTKLEGGDQKYDVYLLSYQYDYDDAGDCLVDLSDIWNGKSTGEDKYVRDKVDAELAETLYPTNKTEKYFLPYGGFSGYMFCYNVTTLDEVLGKDNYVLPRTTDEMFELGDALSGKAFLTLAAAGDGSDYFSPLPWLAQAMGIDNYTNALKGNYYDATSQTWKLAETTPQMIIDNKEAYKDLYSVVAKLRNYNNGYMHVASEEMDYLQVEQVLAGMGYGNYSAKVAFHYNGNYLLQEMGKYLNAQAAVNNPQTIRAKKIPLMSSVIKQTTTIADDAELREVVDYIDGVTTVKPNVSDTDIETVRKARALVGGETSGTIAIGNETTGTKLTKAKDFVRFLTTDKAQEIAIQATGGCDMLPYGYAQTIDLSDDPNIHPFINDFLREAKNAKLIRRGYGINDTFQKYGGFDIFPIDIGFTMDHSSVAAEGYYNNTLNYYTNNNHANWTGITGVITKYKAALGIQ